jgi:hypothetical protein
LNPSGQVGSNTARRSHNENELTDLAKICTATAGELLSALEHLKTRRPSKKLHSFRMALETVWKKDKIQAMEKKLISHRTELMLLLTAMQEYVHL